SMYFVRSSTNSTRSSGGFSYTASALSFSRRARLLVFLASSRVPWKPPPFFAPVCSVLVLRWLPMALPTLSRTRLFSAALCRDDSRLRKPMLQAPLNEIRCERVACSLVLLAARVEPQDIVAQL